MGTTAALELIATQVPGLPNLVVDPVLVSSSGRRLCTGPAKLAYRDLLLPMAMVVTPNLAEAGALLGREVNTVADAVRAAVDLGDTGAQWVVVTGGHLDGDPVDVVWHAGQVETLLGTRVATTNDHGTGCVFAAAITAGLAMGDPPGVAIRAAHDYVHRALTMATEWRIGSGRGPLAWPDHARDMKVGNLT